MQPAEPADPLLPAGEASAASFIIGGGEIGALMRCMDWAKLPLAAPRFRAQSLRTAIDICLSSRFPIALYWGPEYLMLYNDDLLPMVGANKHPWALGRPAREVLPEIWSIIGPLLDSVVETGRAIWSENLMLPLLRSRAPEESYFTLGGRSSCVSSARAGERPSASWSWGSAPCSGAVNRTRASTRCWGPVFLRA